MADAQDADLPPVMARSLAELREQHVALLALWRGNLEDRDKADRAAALRDAAVALGAWLEDEEERVVAQGVFEYWMTAGSGLRGQTAPVAATLVPFDAAAAEGRAAAGETLVETAGSRGADAAEAIFLRLLRVDQMGHIIEGPPVIRAELVGAAGTPGIAMATLVDALAEAGILRLRAAPSRDEEAVEFASRGVARRWPRVKAALEERKRTDTTRDRLRATALLWRQKEQQPGYLLGGDSLEQAKQFLGDLSEGDVLRDFLEASIAKARRERTRYLLAIAIGPALMVLALWGVGALYYSRGEHVGKDIGGIEGAELASVGPNQPTPAAGPTGYVWIGSTDEPMLLDDNSNTSVSPDTVRSGQVYRVASAVNMNLRDGFPDAQNRPAAIRGVAPSDSRLEALEDPRGFDRPSGRQYWMRVRLQPRVLLQYSRTDRRTVTRLREALTSRGFDVRGSERQGDLGPPMVRYYHHQDRMIATAVGRVASENLGNTRGRPAVRCDLVVGATVLPTIVEVSVDGARLEETPREEASEKSRCG